MGHCLTVLHVMISLRCIKLVHYHVTSVVYTVILVMNRRTIQCFYNNVQLDTHITTLTKEDNNIMADQIKLRREHNQLVIEAVWTYYTTGKWVNMHDGRNTGLIDNFTCFNILILEPWPNRLPCYKCALYFGITCEE